MLMQIQEKEAIRFRPLTVSIKKKKGNIALSAGWRGSLGGKGTLPGFVLNK